MKIGKPYIVLGALAFFLLIFRLYWVSRATYEVRPEAENRILLNNAAGAISFLDGSKTPSNETELLKVLSDEWPSQLRGHPKDGKFVDVWGRPIRFEYLKSARAWRFVSSGKDGVFGSSDDQMVESLYNYNGEQAEPSNGDKPSN